MVPLGACAKCQASDDCRKGIVATGYLRCLHTSLPGLAGATADIAANVGEATGIPPIGLVRANAISSLKPIRTSAARRGTSVRSGCP
jgi:hypothetical protein